MIVHRPEDEWDDGNYTRIKNDVIEDTELSMVAYCVYIYLCSKPSSWTIWKSDIANHIPNYGKKKIGEKAVQRALSELSDKGYFEQHQEYIDGKSRWVKTFYEKPRGRDDNQTDTDEHTGESVDELQSRLIFPPELSKNGRRGEVLSALQNGTTASGEPLLQQQYLKLIQQKMNETATKLSGDNKFEWHKGALHWMMGNLEATAESEIEMQKQDRDKLQQKLDEFADEKEQQLGDYHRAVVENRTNRPKQITLGSVHGEMLIAIFLHSDEDKIHPSKSKYMKRRDQWNSFITSAADSYDVLSQEMQMKFDHLADRKGIEDFRQYLSELTISDVEHLIPE